jgi:hypothetical protein
VLTEGLDEDVVEHEGGEVEGLANGGQDGDASGVDEVGGVDADALSGAVGSGDAEADGANVSGGEAGVAEGIVDGFDGAIDGGSEADFGKCGSTGLSEDVALGVYDAGADIGAPDVNSDIACYGPGPSLFHECLPVTSVERIS